MGVIPDSAGPPPGAVVIGRNEARRLADCLRSVLRPGRPVLYVDSGSSDGSPGIARSMGAAVLELDARRPFTAARARNEGFASLLTARPDLTAVQFVDGDCEIREGWMEAASAALRIDPRAGVVHGLLRERRPDLSVYNRICALEWNASADGRPALGGNAMVRVAAFRAAGGFDEALPVGEEADLCVRLRRLGWESTRLRVEMAVHDAGLLRFGQWWRRSIRTGYGYARGAALHGRSPERLGVRQSLSIGFWGALVPAAALGTAPLTRGLGLLLLLLLPLQAGRVARRAFRSGVPPRDAAAYGSFCVLGKFAQLLGLGAYLSGPRGERAILGIVHRRGESGAWESEVP